MLIKVISKTFPKSGKINGITPANSEACHPRFARKCKLNIPQNKTSPSPKTLTTNIFQMGLFGWINDDARAA